MSKKIRIKEEVTSSGLTPRAQKLLDQLVQDFGTPGMLPEERVFKKENASAYIFNLLRGNYQWSVTVYQELFNFLTK